MSDSSDEITNKTLTTIPPTKAQLKEKARADREAKIAEERARRDKAKQDAIEAKERAKQEAMAAKAKVRACMT